MSSRVTLILEDSQWRRPASLGPKLRRAANAALKSADTRGSKAVTILLADDARLKALNATFRGKNKPTNVLSFLANDGAHLGDIALARGVAAREARKSGKSLSDHACHLVVHGVLHLLGYDHETDKDAEAMESLEVKILKGLGISDPYRVRG